MLGFHESELNQKLNTDNSALTDARKIFSNTKQNENIDVRDTYTQYTFETTYSWDSNNAVGEFHIFDTICEKNGYHKWKKLVALLAFYKFHEIPSRETVWST